MRQIVAFLFIFWIILLAYPVSVGKSDSSVGEPYVMFSKEKYYGLVGSNFLMNITIGNPTTKEINTTLLITPVYKDFPTDTSNLFRELIKFNLSREEYSLKAGEVRYISINVSCSPIIVNIWNWQTKFIPVNAELLFDYSWAYAETEIMFLSPVSSKIIGPVKNGEKYTFQPMSRPMMQVELKSYHTSILNLTYTTYEEQRDYSGLWFTSYNELKFSLRPGEKRLMSFNITDIQPNKPREWFPKLEVKCESRTITEDIEIVKVMKFPSPEYYYEVTENGIENVTRSYMICEIIEFMDIQFERNFLMPGVETDLGIKITNLCTHTFYNLDIDIKLKVYDGEDLQTVYEWNLATYTIENMPLCIDGTKLAKYVDEHLSYPKKIHFDELPPQVQINRSFVMCANIDGGVKLGILFSCTLDAIQFEKEIPIIVNASVSLQYGIETYDGKILHEYVGTDERIGDELRLNLTIHNNMSKTVDCKLSLYINFLYGAVMKIDDSQFCELSGEKEFKIQPYEWKYVWIILKFKAVGNYGSENMASKGVDPYIDGEDKVAIMCSRGLINKLYLMFEHDGITTFSNSFGIYVGPKSLASENMVGMLVFTAIIAIVPLVLLNYGIKVSKRRRRSKRIEKEKRENTNPES